MKKLLILCMTAVASFGLFGAAYDNESEQDMQAFFGQLKVNMSNNKPDALVDVGADIMHNYPAEVQGLLDYALRCKGQNGPAYVRYILQSMPKNPRANLSRRSSQVFSLLDVAIMNGNIEGVRGLLQLGADVSESRLISDYKPRPVSEVIATLIERKKNGAHASGTTKISATVEQLKQIQELLKNPRKSKKIKESLITTMKKKLSRHE